MAPNTYNLWTNKELSDLEEMYKSISFSKIAKELGRSNTSVINKIKYLGLTGKNRDASESIKNNVLKILSKNPRMPKAEIAKRLNCSIYRVTKALNG